MTLVSGLEGGVTCDFPLLATASAADDIGPSVVDTYGRFHRYTSTSFTFAAEDHSKGEPAEVISIIRAHFQRWQSSQPSLQEASSPGFIARQTAAYRKIQSSTLDALRKVVKSPKVGSVVPQQYTPESFEQCIAESLPKYLARHGVYCTPSLHAYTIPSGEIFFMATLLDLYDLQMVESADLGAELTQELRRRRDTPVLRLLVKPPMANGDRGAIAFDRTYYGQIAQRLDSVAREVNGILQGQSSLMKRLGIATFWRKISGLTGLFS
jgi:hypothetical protein